MINLFKMIKTALFFCTVLGLCSGLLAENEKPQNRIVGGQIVKDSNEFYPYMVSIQTIDDGIHICGGTIISTRTILTTAWCIIEREHRNIQVIAGTNNWYVGGSLYRAHALIPYADFDPSRFRHDIGLIIVNRKITYTPTVQRIDFGITQIPLNTNGSQVDAFNIGWGAVENGGEPWKELKYVDVKTISHLDCLNRYINTDEVIFATTLCAENYPGQGVCDADIGGPLVYNDEVVGVLSRIYGGCASTYPVIHTRLSSYTDWIVANMESHV